VPSAASARPSLWSWHAAGSTWHRSITPSRTSCAASCARSNPGGRRGRAIGADIGDIAGHQRTLDEAEATLGPLTCLVNNASVSVLERGDLLEVTPESYDRCLNINTRGPSFSPRPSLGA
jgi:NAD(P)-dependent dehydrogenase (short-subunit alcohol dehydrogenase family)